MRFGKKSLTTELELEDKCLYERLVHTLFDGRRYPKGINDLDRSGVVGLPSQVV
ncbi:MAG: hypothetical protein J07HQX50_01416 [Haloquadratum sp. J07HQX50]|nr:MAG: hypothetical protein J07HQX50_01416 [Haloquadratum sp. J07HQX50]